MTQEGILLSLFYIFTVKTAQAPSLFITSTPVTHSGAVFLTFFSPFLLQPHAVWLPFVKLPLYRSADPTEGHVSKQRGHRPSVAVCKHSHIYQQFIEIVNASLWEQSLPPQKASFSTHSCGVKRGVQFCSSYHNASVELPGREEGHAGVNLCGDLGETRKTRNKHVIIARMMPKKNKLLLFLCSSQPAAPAEHFNIPTRHCSGLYTMVSSSGRSTQIFYLKGALCNLFTGL